MFDPDFPHSDDAPVPDPSFQAFGHSPWPPPMTAPVGLTQSAPSAPKRRRRRPAIIAAAATLAVIAAGVGVSSAVDHGGPLVANTESATSPSKASSLPVAQSGAPSTESLSASEIFDKVDPAVVDINTTLADGEAAGTGMVLTSSGLVLTNNHVINGATSIEVQIQGTGPTYTAHVVGYDASDDVAVLQLDDASNLATITAGNTSGLQAGDDVVAIGNALGAAGPHAVSSGTIDALDQSVTAGTDVAGESETLNGMIETTATLQPGDSGGVLVDSSGAVIGMNSIGTVSGGGRFGDSGSGDGYAIPIDTALTIARQIVAGQASANVHIGARAILGIEVADATGNVPGVVVGGVQDGGPAATAGIQAGDTITAIGDASTPSISELQAALGQRSPGDKVTVTWANSNGDTQSATITLVAGPPA